MGLTNGVSFGPQMRASQLKKSDSETGPAHVEKNTQLADDKFRYRGKYVLTGCEHAIRGAYVCGG
jgi:hypothetical protein